MRLKKIKLAGFKSFVDPTTIPLPGQLIGIVGPNGCGKSNVIDAVRWVMGESSAKHLRGDSMADVIFSGSSSRKPVGQAAIELVFDNSDGGLGGPYAAYSEISVKRSVSRDGQSNYYLNGARCRRKDITEVFLGTGLGPRSYAIIEQGTISRLIEAKPDELRVFIEEAAGISKYKERRKETETRIGHTRENLNRINDVRDEIEKRLQTLQRQAKTAERYKELKQQERSLKAQVHALRWRALAAEASVKEREAQTLETALEGLLAELRRVEAAGERHREQHIESSDLFNAVQGEYYGLGAEIARVEQAIQHAKDMRVQQRRDLEAAEGARAEVEAHLASDQHLVAELEQGLAAQEDAQSEAQEREQDSAARLGEAEDAMQHWQQQWDEFNSHASSQVRAAEVERARLHHLDQQLEQLRSRLARLAVELDGLVPGALEEDVGVLAAQRDEVERVVSESQLRLDEIHRRITEQRQQHQMLNTSLNDARSERQTLQGRHASLQALQEQALGRKRDGSVKTWLESQGLNDAQRLAQALTVESGWERAVEMVLGLNLEAVCVEGMENVAHALSGLQQGQLGLFDIRGARAIAFHHAGVATPLTAKVQAPWPMEGLLGSVYAADDLDVALALRAQLEPHDSVVTREGVWLARDWLRVVRSADEKAGVLARERELKELAQQLEIARGRSVELEAQLDESNHQVHSLEQERDSTQRSLREITQRRAEIQAQLGAKEARLDQMRQRGERVRAEMDEIHAQVAGQETEITATRARLHEALAATEGHEEQRGRLLAQRDEYRASLDQMRAQSRADRDQAHQVALRLQAMRTQRSSTAESIERMQGQLLHLVRRHEQLTLALANGETPLESMAAELASLLAKRISVEERLAEARRQVEEAEHALREANDQRHTIEAKVTAARSALERARFAGQELKVRTQTLEEQLIESGFELQALLQELPEQGDETERQQELERVTQHIQRLGAINLAAIEEYAEQSERKVYLDAQHADLSEALDTLENAIRKIDRETRQRFQETFEKVNAGFQAMFPRLFGGGHASLELTGEDLLETGVTVMARPPGKRNSTIHLLSGGEKALTAIAMVFSIFELNPAPFCMLDEVDAPLDEANVGRFCQMVKEMSARVQFIYITHNKATMEMAEQLLGVTMHEPGASRLVAVDVDEAVQLAAAS